MLELGLYVAGAFLFYILILPLIGIFMGCLIYNGTPYLAGIAVASLAHKVFHGSFFDIGVFWIVAFVWAALLVHIRQTYNKIMNLELSWHEGHYLAARTILLIGQPYRKAKRVLASG